MSLPFDALDLGFERIAADAGKHAQLWIALSDSTAR